MDGPSLPRSIRWRLQLGLLQLPESADTDSLSLQELYEWNATQLQEQRERYRDLVEKHEANHIVFPLQQEQHEEEAEQAPVSPAVDNNAMLDPLTAMVREQEAQEKRRQELDLKYRKERARRKRGIYEGETDVHGDSGDRGDTYSSHQTLQIIDKDLHRLQPDHHTYHHSRKKLQEDGKDDEFDTSVKERTAHLAELLLVHAREHPVLGYRQGMHEIASYLLLVIEMDLFDIESALQSSATTIEEQSLSILDSNFLLPDAYTMLERVMSYLSPAYDVKQSASQSSSPMEEMAHSVVSKLKDVACDEPLYQTVRAMHCPPELYCTRWIRLMYSREVLGWRNVLLLWDIFMDLITAHENIMSMEPSRYTRPGANPALKLGTFTLMQVLESTATCMILLQRQALLEGDPNESIHTLMNVPPLTNIVPLTATLLSLMRRFQMGKDDLSSSMATLSAFGQRARDAFQQLAPTAGESLRKLYNSASSPNHNATSLPEHPLAAAAQPHKEKATRKVSPRKKESRVTMSDALKESTSVITDFLMEVKSSGTMEVPEDVWEALAQVDSVRKQLQGQPTSDTTSTLNRSYESTR